MMNMSDIFSSHKIMKMMKNAPMVMTVSSDPVIEEFPITIPAHQEEDGDDFPDVTNILSATVDPKLSGKALVDNWWKGVTLKYTNIQKNDDSQVIETPDEISGSTK
jgi:hypothetical protein